MLQHFLHIFSLSFLLALLTPVCSAEAQDMVFSNSLSAPLYTNPAFAGVSGQYYANAAARSQFTAVGNVYTTFYLDGNAYVPSWNSGFGLFVMNDRAAGGLFQTTSAGLTYAYAFPLSENIILRPALQAVFYNLQRNAQNVTFPDMLGTGGAAYFPVEGLSAQRVDFAAGLVLSHPVFQAGVAVQHIGAPGNETYITYGRPSVKITAHAQAVIALVGESTLRLLSEWTMFENVALTPQVKYIHQTGFNYLIAGATVRSGGLFAGVAVRTPLQQKTFSGALSAGLDTYLLKLGYSFDFITAGGNLRGWDSGSHELFLHYSFGTVNEQASRRNRQKVRRLNPACGCPY
ncbi:MAG: PorP/SprF family type IX secretion system membrane protein [Prevotellaceae bacterium]|nr:PorP/SprF family type IX secretion system membrane protein [Prevotellaceae bacterium]